jgi:hypothetical protein
MLTRLDALIVGDILGRLKSFASAPFRGKHCSL